MDVYLNDKRFNYSGECIMVIDSVYSDRFVTPSGYVPHGSGLLNSIAYSNTSKFYRVILGTSDSLRNAIYCKEKNKNIYPACWLLYKEY